VNFARGKIPLGARDPNNRLKMRDMKQWHSQKGRGGNCDKRKLWHNTAGGGNAAQASMDSQKNT